MYVCMYVRIRMHTCKLLICTITVVYAYKISRHTSGRYKRYTQNCELMHINNVLCIQICDKVPRHTSLMLRTLYTETFTFLYSLIWICKSRNM
jgi:hypothetical protein